MAGVREGLGAWVVGQDKGNGSLWPAARDFLRHLPAFSIGHYGLHSVSMTRASRVPAATVNTAPRTARRKRFGSSEYLPRIVTAAAAALTALAILSGLGRVLHLRITLTDSSAPAGIYRLVTCASAGRGALVAACLPQPIASEGLTRGYLGRGDCPAGAEPVAKVIGALPGDVVAVEPGWVAVNGARLQDSRTAARDSAGKPLAHVPWGVRRVSTGEVWLFGFNDPRSWDSRYFGPVPLTTIRGALQPVVTW
jgi:conjugative transfer signal peptidase TraF